MNDIYQFITQDELHIKWFKIGYRFIRKMTCGSIWIMISDLINCDYNESFIKGLSEATYYLRYDKTIISIQYQP